MIKGNKSDFADTDFELHAKRGDKLLFPLFRNFKNQ